MKKLKCITLILIVLALMLIIPNVSNAATEYTYSDTEQGIEWSYELDDSENVVNLKCKTTSVIGEVTIPSTIDGKKVISLKGYYDKGAFQDCAGLTNITIPNTITTIGEYAFKNCTGLKVVTIPDSIIKIGSYAFQNCSGMTSVTLSQNLVSIGDAAFWNCSGLKSLTIPNSVTTIGESAFRECSGIKELTLSENLTKINARTFEECSGLTSVIIPDSVTTLCNDYYSGTGAFAHCTNLEKILIPDTVATIEEDVFFKCNKLTIYGHDEMVSKQYAQDNNINFKYIEEWDESDVGDDITPPTVKSLRVDYSSVLGYPSESSLCYVPAGKSIKIYVEFSELLSGETAPTLIIKCGKNGENIEVSNGVISGSSVVYTYTIREQDKGIMTAVELSGGDVTDESGNSAQLSCPELIIQYTGDHVYANGTGVSSNNGGNSNEGTNNGSNAGTGTQNGTVQGSGTTGNKEENKIDNTTATGKLPQAGLTIGLTVSIVVLLVGCVFVYFKYNKLRGI